MTIHVNIGEAKARLSELIAKVEAGEEVVIARGGDVVVRLVRERSSADTADVVAAMRRRREQRERDGLTVSQDEIRQWRDEGRA